jgi:phage baseplate assembly protein W
MQQQYYKLPLRLSTVFDEDSKGLARCNETASIDQYIELLLTTCPGEHKFDKNFGCGIWDMDFERVVSRQKWTQDFTGHISEAIKTYEKRLKDVSIEIDINDVSRFDYALQTTAIKQEVKIIVKANLVSTNEPCGFHYAIYLGPLSTE